nr:hypothetical protein [Thermoplasmata archaeon]
MKLLSLQKTLIIIILSFLLGGTITLLLFRQHEIDHSVTIEVPATRITMKIDSLNCKIERLKRKFEFSNIWRFMTTDKESIFIDSTTSYADIPIVKTSADTSFKILVNNKPISISFTWWAIHKGKLFELGFFPEPMKYTYELPEEKKFLRFYGSLGAAVDQNKNFIGEFESGFVFGRKAILFSRVEGSNKLDIQIRVGAKIGFNL